jgi:GGDEF domain-containing protein
VVGHLGRGEFAIIARNTSAEGAERLTRRMKASLAAERAAADLPPSDFTIRANYVAVSDYAETALDTLEMLERASAGLHGGALTGLSADFATEPAQSPPVS